MDSRQRRRSSAARRAATRGAAAMALLVTAWPAQAIPVATDTVAVMRTERLRSDGTAELVWEELAFNDVLPMAAHGNGLRRVFPAGERNGAGLDGADPAAGPFSRAPLGSPAAPVDDDVYAERLELFYPSPVPEPSSAWLVVAGLVVVARLLLQAVRRQRDGME